MAEEYDGMITNQCKMLLLQSQRGYRRVGLIEIRCWTEPIDLPERLDLGGRYVATVIDADE